MLAYGNSQTWRSDAARLNGEFRGVQAALNRMRFDRSPFIPRTPQDYSRHKAEISAEKAEGTRLKMEQVSTEQEMARKQERPLTVPFTSGEYLYQRAAGIALESIWSPLWQPSDQHPLAAWPTSDEFKEEGDERHTSGFGRYLPIPRVPGNSTVVWKQKNFVEMYSLDQVHHVPRKYPLELPNDYEQVQPQYDEAGNVIDDPNEPGKTITVEDLRRRFILTPNTGALIPPVHPPSGPRQITFHSTTGAQSRQSNLNPGVPAFSPRYHNVPPMDELQRNLRAYQPSRAGSLQQAHHQSQEARSGYGQSAGTNPFAVLASISNSDASSEGSTRAASVPPSHLSRQDLGSNSSHGVRSEQNNSNRDIKESELTLELPDWMLEDERQEALKAQRNARQQQATQVQNIEQAQQDVFRAFQLPSLESVSRANRPNHGLQIQTGSMTVGRGTQGRLGNNLQGSSVMGTSHSNVLTGRPNFGTTNPTPGGANPYQTWHAPRTPAQRAMQSRIPGFGDVPVSTTSASYGAQTQYGGIYGGGPARGLGEIGYPHSQYQQIPSGPGVLGFPPSPGAYLETQYRTGAQINSPFFRNGVPLTSAVGGTPSPELTMLTQEYWLNRPYQNMASQPGTSATAMPQTGTPGSSIAQTGSHRGRGSAYSAAVYTPAAITEVVEPRSTVYLQQSLPVRNGPATSRSRAQSRGSSSCRGSSRRGRSVSRGRIRTPGMPHYKDLEDDDELQYYESVSGTHRQPHQRFPFVEDGDDNDQDDSDQVGLPTPGGSTGISPIDAPMPGAFSRRTL